MNTSTDPPYPSPSWRELDVNGKSVLRSHQQIIRLIKSYLNAEAASFLAIPEFTESGDLSGWRAGSGRSLTVPGENGAEAEQANGLRSQIERVAEQLEREGDAGRVAGLMLLRALVTPEGVPSLMSDSGKPVLINWGFAAPGQHVPGIDDAQPIPSPADAAACSDEPLCSSQEPRDSRPPPRPSRWPWLIPVGLSAALVWLGLQAARPLPVQENIVTPEAIKLPDPRLGLPERLAGLESALSDATDALPRFTTACTVPEPESTPLDPKLVAHCPQGVAKRPDELLIVIDASRSMRDSIKTPAELSIGIHRAWERGDWRRRDQIARMIGLIPGPSRMQVTHEIVKDVIGNAPPDMSLGLISFHNCHRIRRHGPVGFAARPDLMRRVDQIRPTEGTALGAAIDTIGRTIKGGRDADDPVNVLLISDGLDSCSADSCAAARNLNRTHPGVAINVIDLSGFQALACVSEATGGVYTSRGDKVDLHELTEATRNSALRHSCLSDTPAAAQK